MTHNIRQERLPHLALTVCHKCCALPRQNTVSRIDAVLWYSGISRVLSYPESVYTCLMQSSLLRQTRCLHSQCFRSGITPGKGPRLRSPSGLSSILCEHGASKVSLKVSMRVTSHRSVNNHSSGQPVTCYLQAAGLHLAHRTCNAIPDQHAIGTLPSISSRDLPAWLDGESPAMHHSATAVQVSFENLNAKQLHSCSDDFAAHRLKQASFAGFGRYC